MTIKLTELKSTGEITVDIEQEYCKIDITPDSYFVITYEELLWLHKLIGIYLFQKELHKQPIKEATNEGNNYIPESEW